MLFTRSMHLATTILILSITSAASAIRVQPRHDGRSHQGAHDAAAPQLRQRQVNGPAVGIQPQSSRTALLPVPVSTPTDTLLGNGPLTLTSTLPSDYASSSPTTVAQITNAPTSEVNPYIFLPSILQVPVATICPDTPPILSNTTAGPGRVNATVLLPNGSSTVYLSSSHPTNGNSFDPSNYTPVPLPSPISVCYPDTDPDCPSDPENTNAFSPTPIPLPSANTNAKGNDAAERVVADPTARILLDANGCQTIYSPSYTAVCKTTVRMVGMPEATVTKCGQWVTFSSDMRGCGKAVATGSVGGGGAAAAGSGARGAAAEARDDGGDEYRGSTTGISATAPGITPLAGATLPTMTIQPGTYYAAHWVDVARGGVPTNVRVEECQGRPVTCQTFKESWSESKITGVVVKESVASFEGPAVLTSGSSTITTTLSLSSTVTKTVTTVSTAVVRQRLDSETTTSTPELSSSVVKTSETLQEAPQVTIQLVKVTAPAVAPTTMMEPAPAIQSQGVGRGEPKDAEHEGEDGSGNAGMQEEGDGYKADVGDEGEGGVSQDGVTTVTVEEMHTSTHLIYETRTMTP